MCKRIAPFAVLLLVSLAARAQINVFVGGNLQGHYSWIREDEPLMELGFGGGINFVYWEYEYWFLKAGLDYYNLNSTALNYPDDFGIEPENAEDKINISYTEHAIGLPLMFYFRPYESRANALLVTASLSTLFVAGLKEDSEDYGETVLKGAALKPRIKSRVGIGVGYQRQLDKNMFLNIVPAFNMDLRGHVAFNTISVTTELIFGIY
jgi:hypothetical protein